MAAWFGIKSFDSKLKVAHIKLLADNTTTVAYLDNTGERNKSVMSQQEKFGNGVTRTII